MFYLLVVLIAIALIGLVTATTSSYIGDAFQSGSADAKAVTLINGGSQIAAATTLYETRGNGTVSGISALTSQGYLSAVPEAPAGFDSFNVTDTYNQLYATVVASGTADIGDPTCSAINERAGLGKTPSATTAITNSSIPAKFGCDSDKTFFYKL